MTDLPSAPPAAADPRAFAHDEAWDLLPWLAVDRLEGRELVGVLRHLEVCPVCREELRFLPELRAVAEEGDEVLSDGQVERNLRRLHREMDAGGAGRPTGHRVPPTLAWAAVLAAAVVGLIVWTRVARGPDPGVAVAVAEGPAVYRTLSDSPGPPVEGMSGRVRVVFAAGTSLAAVERLLVEERLTVADGPGPRGIWTLGLGGREIAAVLERLRDRPEVRLAEPVGSVEPATVR